MLIKWLYDLAETHSDEQLVTQSQVIYLFSARAAKIISQSLLCEPLLVKRYSMVYCIFHFFLLKSQNLLVYTTPFY